MGRGRSRRAQRAPCPPGRRRAIIAVDPLPSARGRALAFGADYALDPAAPDFADQVRAATAGKGLDFAFDCAGVPAVREQAASVLGLGGSLILVGISPRPLTITEGLTFNYLQTQVRGTAPST